MPALCRPRAPPGNQPSSGHPRRAQPSALGSLPLEVSLSSIPNVRVWPGSPLPVSSPRWQLGLRGGLSWMLGQVGKATAGREPDEGTREGAQMLWDWPTVVLLRLRFLLEWGR